MKLLQVSIFFLVLWLNEAKTHEAECSVIRDDTCWNLGTKFVDECALCHVNDIEITPDNDVVIIVPKFKNGSHAEITSVYFAKGHVTSFPVIYVDNKALTLLDVCLNDTKTTVINANFFGDKALNLQIFASLNNSLTIAENSFEKTTNLETFRYMSGHIAEIPSKTFFGLKKLNTFIIKDTDLEHIDPIWFTDLQNLGELNLNYNKIKLLEAGVFDKLTNLVVIYLEKNLIETIPSDLFKCNWKLTEIYFENNKIKHIGNGVFASLQHLTYLDMEKNICVDKLYYGSTLLSDAEKDLAECN